MAGSKFNDDSSLFPHNFHTMYHTLWLNTMLKWEWGSWHLHWRRDSLTEKHTVEWAVTTTYDEKKYLEYSSEGKQSERTDTDTRKHEHKHTQKAIMLSIERRICDWLLCVFTCCLSLLSPHLSVSTITPSLRVSFSLSFFVVISLSHTKRRRWVEGFSLIRSPINTQALTKQHGTNPVY